MEYFVDQKSIVRNIWNNTDVVLVIFAGSAAEFALNKAVDWLYFSGKLPLNPIERLFSTVAFAQKIIFSDQETAIATINSINTIHKNIEKNRGTSIPNWAFQDVLFMLIDYSIRAFELLERKLTWDEKEELYGVFLKLGTQMELQNLPQNYSGFTVARLKNLGTNLEKGKFTTHLFEQYKKHLGSFRYFILIRIQTVLVPKLVGQTLFKKSVYPTKAVLACYKISKKVHFDKVIKSIILPKKYKNEILKMEQF